VRGLKKVMTFLFSGSKLRIPLISILSTVLILPPETYSSNSSFSAPSSLASVPSNSPPPSLAFLLLLACYSNLPTGCVPASIYCSAMDRETRGGRRWREWWDGDGVLGFGLSKGAFGWLLACLGSHRASNFRPV
jgi:hypothetical protein